MKISVVIPVYRAQTTIEQLVAELAETVGQDADLEVVLVDDASTDGSGPICRSLAERHPWVRYVGLSRNFGEQSAVLAGLHHATGDCVVTMDDDLQNPPSEVPKLVAALGQGADVVYGRYIEKRHSAFRNFGSWLTGRVAVMALNKPTELYLSSFRAMSRFVVDELKRVADPFPYLDGYILRTTRNVLSVDVEHHARADGGSGYTLRKLVGLWLNLVTNFSLVPLRVATVVGFLVAAAGGVAAIAFTIERLRNPALPLGWASLIVSLTVLSGIQLFALGMIGEYLGRMFLRNSGNPQFVVRETLNCEAEQPRELK